MNYQSGDKLKNRYLSNDAFTSLKNKLGGRSITSLGNKRRRNSYKIANQGFDLLEYKNFIYKLLVLILLILISIYMIPQTRYFIHGYNSNIFDDNYVNKNLDTQDNVDYKNIYNIAPVFLKTDQFISKQKTDDYIKDDMFAYDYISKNIIGLTSDSSSSTFKIRLFSDSGFKNNFLIQQENILENNNKDNEISTTTNDISSSTNSEISSSTDLKNTNKTEIFIDKNTTYQSYIFEGLGYGQMIAKLPPEIKIKKDSFLYIRTINGLKPIAKIVNVDEDNNTTFTIINAQLIVAPQNIYKIIFNN